MSETLKAFYIAYDKWLKKGAPDNDIFSRRCGLCGNYAAYAISVGVNVNPYKELGDQFIEAGLHPQFPFSTVTEARDELYWSQACYNQKRIAWVLARVAEITAVA